MDKIFLTGATGLVGSHIAELFIKKEIDITCLIRKTSKTDFLQKLKAKTIIGDISDKKLLDKQLKNFDFVIHTAGLASDWGKYETFYKNNVEGTMNILESCKNNNIKNVIITGSISSYGEENFLGKKDETYPYNSHYNYFLDKIFPCAMNYYRDTKAIATKKAIKFAKDNNINLTIIEPTWVYGEREFHSGFYEYLKTAKDKIPFMPGKKTNKFHSIYAKELARAYLLAFKKKLKGVNTIIIGNQKADTMDKIFGTYCKQANIKKPQNIPKIFIYPIGFMLELIYTTLKIKTPPLLTRGRVNMFYDNIEYDVSKAEKLLGFKTEMTLEESIKKSVEWYKKENLI